MSFLNALEVSMNEDTVITHMFLLEYNPHISAVHAFFEGKTDESFYGTYIRNLKPEDWKIKTYICGNKNKVYYAHRELSDKHEKHQPLLFFVDKDLEDIIPINRLEDKSIYVTSYYSIENYIVTHDAIDRIWSELLRQSSGTQVSDKLTEAFIAALEDIHSILIDIMSWALMHRREENSLNLGSIRTKDYFRIDDELKVIRKLDLNDMIILLDIQTKQNTTPILKEKIIQCRDELLKYKPKEIIRGHNEIEFFVEFIKRLRETSAKKLGKPIRIHVEITSANAIDIMGPRVRIPEGLEVFLKYHLQIQKSLI